MSISLVQKDFFITRQNSKSHYQIRNINISFQPLTHIGNKALNCTPPPTPETTVSVAEGPYLCLKADPMLKHLVVVHGDPQIVRVIY